MKPSEKEIFISYSRKDFDRVSAIKKEIEAATGAKCWMDMEGISYDSHDFVEVIAKAIDSALVFLFMLSEHSQNSTIARGEIALAQKKGKQITLVNINNCAISDSFTILYSQYNLCDYNNNLQKEKLFSEICTWLGRTLSKDMAIQQLLDENQDPEELNALGNNLYKERNYADAVKFYQKAAEMGYVDSQYNLGYCYEHGRGVLKNIQMAVYWYTPAAEKGHRLAQYHLAQCYDNVDSILHDQAAAIKWYQEAAAQGNAEAQNKIGLCYLNGTGLEKNAEKAAEWLRKAAEQGIDTAQYYLGRCYQNGVGVNKDLDKAARWISRAAALGNVVAQYLMKNNKN